MQINVMYEELQMMKESLQFYLDYYKELYEKGIITHMEFKRKMKQWDATNEKVNRLLYSNVGKSYV